MWLNLTKLIVCLILVAGLCYNIYLSLGQAQDVTAICKAYGAGSDTEGLLQAQQHYDVTIKGPYGEQNDPSGQQIIFCADLSLCETSCEVYFKADRVIQSRCHNCNSD